MSLVALIIDMQVDFFVHERLSQRRAALTARVNELVSVCRKARAPVVWVKQEWKPDLSDAMLEARRNRVAVTIAGTPGAEILPQLDIRSSDHVVIKKRYSPFFGTNLDEVLVRLRPTGIIVAGINTHACVRAAVVDAYQRDYEVIMARDCIDSYDAAHHDVSLKYMDGNLGRAMDNEEIRSLLCPRAN